ncbi:MAG: 2,3-bisphosphoglycerate-independent phosphoglycerate mutase [Clostridiales bacterium]|nr:MAG: 2,3-bisphosphoglycerate-independent phosphoglycerate mutase [Clostridiales bacterium]
MDKKVVLIVMDGIGQNTSEYGNAVKAARTPTLDMLMDNYPNTFIKAHGTAVGLPSDEDMGNSEVGHNALGCGQVYSQGAKLVNESIETGAMFKSETWQELTGNCKNNNSTLHFLGLLSDGNVHSNINHLFAMMKAAKADGVKKCRIHILLDGRDVPATSAMQYVDALEGEISALVGNDFDIKIASGGGRMQITMDRYEANWPMVELGWKTHVLGEGRIFPSAKEAVETLRNETGVIDQDLPSFVIGENGKPCGTVEDGDSFILFNFRGDRALEISRAFDDETFTAFDRKRHPKVVYAGMLQYDGDLKIPHKYLVSPPHIENTLSETLVKSGVKQYAVSETQKYGHVTYFWNGNRSEKTSDQLEIFEEVLSDVVPFEQRPWMKAAEVTDKIIEAIKSNEYGFIRANYPNGDMVGHTGNFQAAVIAVEAVDLCLARVLKALEDKDDYVLLITADHGNADEMYEKAKEGKPIKPKTAHTLNPVPFIVVDKAEKQEIKDGVFGLANVAATVTKIMNIKTPSMWEESIIK